jgi:hypothetical protein
MKILETNTSRLKPKAQDFKNPRETPPKGKKNPIRITTRKQR